MKHCNLAAERVRLKMTQEELAKKLGVTRNTISRWEGDISSMPGESIMKAASIFGCSIDYLLDETDDRLVRTPRD